MIRLLPQNDGQEVTEKDMYRDEEWYNPNLFICEVSRNGQLRNTLTKQLGESGVLRVEVRHECYCACKIHFFQLGGIH